MHGEDNIKKNTNVRFEKLIFGGLIKKRLPVLELQGLVLFPKDTATGSYETRDSFFLHPNIVLSNINISAVPPLTSKSLKQLLSSCVDFSPHTHHSLIGLFTLGLLNDLWEF
jgi:hypothetical protein